MIGDALPDSDHVTRYCKPSAVGADGASLAAAFKPRDNEPYLSVNWIEYFDASDEAVAVRRVRDVFRARDYTLRRRGRFAVMNVGAVKTAAREALDRQLRIDHRPLEDDQSHAGIHGYGANDLAVAVEISRVAGRGDVYPAIAP